MTHTCLRCQTKCNVPQEKRCHVLNDLHDGWPHATLPHFEHTRHVNIEVVHVLNLVAGTIVIVHRHVAFFCCLLLFFTPMHNGNECEAHYFYSNSMSRRNCNRLTISVRPFEFLAPNAIDSNHFDEYFFFVSIII